MEGGRLLPLLLWAAPLIVVARPCSESDIYPGYPLPKDREFGSVRPYPSLMDCSQLDLANVRLKADEALLLSRAVGRRINGEFRNISVLDGIKSIVLDGVEEAGDAVVAELAAGLTRSPPHSHNVTLALASAGITSVGAAELASLLSAAGSTVVSLRMDWNTGIGDAGASAIGRALVGNRALRMLGLERCGIADAGVIQLATSLATAPTAAAHAATVAASGTAVAASVAAQTAMAASSVRELYLEGNRIGAAGSESLGYALRSSKVERLGLALNPIGPLGARHLADALRRNGHLVTLDLAFCEIGDDGAEALGVALRSNTRLRELRLQGNGIGTRGAAALADALRINPVALRSLNLRLNELDEPAAQGLLGAARDALASSYAAQHRGTAAGAGLESLRLEHNHRLAPSAGAAIPQPIRPETLAAIDAEIHVKQ